MTAPPWPGLVIGVGRPERGDDGVGPAVAAALAGQGVAAVAHAGDGADLLVRWPLDRPVIIVDAMRMALPEGEIRRFDALADPPPAEAFAVSSHALGLGWAIAMGRALRRLPPRLVVFGIAATRFALGSGLSPPVARARDEVTRRVLAEVDR